ncbi:lysophospholipid acyltransferase family protein [Polyangium sp. y55x31]|uniref:lysophospholipid acyltransferase family protein n=1 Tax=Polyangium sp. y55x31 TaxID=3042688 RepID=UPI002482B1EC|nr:lysophospholipid acyltransferase family protein [Polyangium sp. y55x31]MDI1484371.1 lysophospholipid acyltransferase family protein [Polyangium sp. y55x31]
MSVRRFWQLLASWICGIGIGIVGSTITLLTFGAFSRTLSPWIVRAWGKSMLRLARVTVSVEGAEHLSSDTMKIATFNHGSLLDSFLIASIMPSGSVAAVKREMFYYPILGFTMYLCGFVFLDRRNSARSRKQMAKACKRMERNRLTVFISPEGTRARTHELLPFKKGAFFLALDSGAPIVPVVIEGAFDLHPPTRWTTDPGHVRIRVLPPRSMVGLSVETIPDEIESLRKLYATELATMRAEGGKPAIAPVARAA